MDRTPRTPIYAQVAYDIASKIADGTLPEGQRFIGRSLMGPQYGVSSETIRRALRLLADMDIIDIRQNRGATIRSRSRAVEYMEQYRSDKDLGALKGHLKKLVAQRDALNEEIAATFQKIMDLQERFRHSNQLRTHEFPISAHSAALGRTLEQLRFRTSTGGTVIAVRHEGRLLLSPGPDTALEAGDTLVVACSVSDMGRVAQLLN